MDSERGVVVIDDDEKVVLAHILILNLSWMISPPCLDYKIRDGKPTCFGFSLATKRFNDSNAIRSARNWTSNLNKVNTSKKAETLACPLTMASWRILSWRSMKYSLRSLLRGNVAEFAALCWQQPKCIGENGDKEFCPVSTYQTDHCAVLSVEHLRRALDLWILSLVISNKR